MSQAGNQEIKCSVQTCRYNDKSRFCTLEDITVGSEPAEAKSKQETICKSFDVSAQ